MEQPQVAIPDRTLRTRRPYRQRPFLRLLEARGIAIRPFGHVEWQPEFGTILLVLGNLNWYPAVKHQLLTSPVSELPKVILWHYEPLPLPRTAGVGWPWLDHREIAKILLRDPRATDPYTNYFVLRRLHRRGLPHRLFASTQERVEFLRKHGIPAEHLPLGYYPAQGRDLGLSRDIDALFLGASSLRRRLKLAYLHWRGIKVTALGDWNNSAYWGEDRVRLINRARIFLNIPRFRAQFAHLRFVLGAANKALIVSEPLYNSFPFEAGRDYVAAGYRDMPDAIRYYLTHEDERREIAEAAHRLVMEKCSLAASVDRMAASIKELLEGGRHEDSDTRTPA